MTVELHEVAFSFDQPNNTRTPLISLLQQLQSHPVPKDSQAAALLGTRKVLIVDSRQDKAEFLARLLVSAGYAPFIVASPLDAYTLFLQGNFHAFVIILSEDSAPGNQFFLNCLAQQYLQRYNWKVPFVRLYQPSSDQSSVRSTEPLAQSPRETLPLDQRRITSSFPQSPWQSGELEQPSKMPAPPPQQQRAPGSRPLGQSRGLVKKIPLTGISIGRYQLKSIIGENPSGSVYLTHDRHQNRSIALKTIQTNLIPSRLTEGMTEDDNLFLSEWNVLQLLEHPHLAPVLNIGKATINESQIFYKVMPHYGEGSLQSWLSRSGGYSFTPADVARVIEQIAEAVQFLHVRGVLYQNFKLTNILLVNKTENMRDLQVTLADLGLVPDIMSLPKTPASYRYLAPEQWEGEVFTSSDQYGLAVMAYELLTGCTPFQGNSEASMRRMHLTMSPPPPSSFNAHIHQFIDNVLLRALAKRPEGRFESVSAFAAALSLASNS